jgi:hypothetical protein
MIEEQLENSHTPSAYTQKKINKLLAEDQALQSKTYSYYQAIKKRDLHEYLSPKVQTEMHKAAAVLGDSFMDVE